MKLLNDATSPFGRKVLVACLELGIPIQEEFVDIYKPGPIDALNPLRQIPTLVVNGEAIYDSDVILAYLAAQQPGNTLVPSHGRWEVLTRASLGNGLMESVLQRVVETRRPAGERSNTFIVKMEERIWRVLAKLETYATQLMHEPFAIDQITLGCALEYVDFRFTAEWRERFTALAQWQGGLASRPSMTATQPRRTSPVCVG
jgi:glutathione S-transferase